jgi:hypothetical protein
MEMTIDGHYRGSRISHNNGTEGAKVVGIKRMSQEELDRGFTEFRVQLSYIEQLLQRNIEEKQ